MEATGDAAASSKGPKMPNLFLIAAAAGGPLENVSTLSPASPPAESIRYLFLFVTAASLFILAVVWGVLLYSLVRFRRGKPADDIAPRTVATEPPQVYGSIPIEIAWTVAPAIIVFLLTLVIVRTEFEVRVNPDRVPAGAQPLRATVIGHQWWWEYVIEPADEQAPGIVTANELHVPATAAIEEDSASRGGPARPIYLTLQSADVCHSFWVPRLAGKTDLIPGARIRRGFKRQSRGCMSASAPNIAARSMPACYCEFTSIRRENSPPGWRTRPSLPPVTPPRATAGKVSSRIRASTATPSAARRHKVNSGPTSRTWRLGKRSPAARSS